jgi:hypothetical protein
MTAGQHALDALRHRVPAEFARPITSRCAEPPAKLNVLAQTK